MNKIDFDGVVIVNYAGIQNLGLPEGWEAVYDQLVKNNSFANVSNGYVFLDSITHVYQKWRILNSLSLSTTSFFANFKDLWKNHFRLVNTELRFCGIFNILSKNVKIDYEYHTRYFLKATDFSYANIANHPETKIKLPENTEFRLVDNQVFIDSRGYTVLPYNLPQDDISEQEIIKSKLYFKKNDVLDACYEHFENNKLKLKDTPADRYYKNGKLFNGLDETVSKIKKKSKLPTIETLGIIVAANFQILRNPKRPLFETQEDIYEYLETEFPNIMGLKKDTIKKFISQSTKELNEIQEPPTYSERYLPR